MFDSLFGQLPKTSSGKSYEIKLLDGLFGVCSSPKLVLPLPLQTKCQEETLSSVDFIDFCVNNNPKILFFGIQSKLDYIQIIQYNTIVDALSIPTEKYGPLNLQQYTIDTSNNVLIPLRKYNNFILFFVTGVVHTFVNQPFMPTATDQGIIIIIIIIIIITLEF